MKSYIIIAATLIFSINIFSQQDEYSSVLKNSIDSASGFVDYANLKSNKETLNAYVDYLSTTFPEDNWSERKKKAFWLNVYNVNILKIVVDNYPFKKESIEKDKEGDGGMSITVKYHKKKKEGIMSIKKDGINAWDLPFIKLKDKTYTLNEIEHDIIRNKYKDPRVHAAFNSACKSSPKVVNFIFTEENVDFKLNLIMKDFVNDTSKNTITNENVKLSKVFEWYRRDFTGRDHNLIDYINMYSNTKVSSDAKLEFLDFDWSLNEK